MAPSKSFVDLPQPAKKRKILSERWFANERKVLKCMIQRAFKRRLRRRPAAYSAAKPLGARVRARSVEEGKPGHRQKKLPLLPHPRHQRLASDSSYDLLGANAACLRPEKLLGLFVGIDIPCIRMLFLTTDNLIQTDPR